LPKKKVPTQTMGEERAKRVRRKKDDFPDVVTEGNNAPANRVKKPDHI